MASTAPDPFTTYTLHEACSTTAVVTEASPAASPSGADSAGAPPQGERERLIWAMEQCAWVQAKAARLLKVTPRQLGYALRKYSIEVHKF